MTPTFGDAYRAAYPRIDTRVRALSADGRDPGDIPVPGCPGWSVHCVVSHLTGIATDALAGRLTGIPDDDFTAGQVNQRAGRPIEDVLAEWAPAVDGFATVIDQAGLFQGTADVLTHEGDIAEALGGPVPPEDGWWPSARKLCRGRITRIDRPGSLTVVCDGETWQGGSGGDGPVASVEVEPWELFRGVMSRRSGDQMRSWPWDGDPEPWLERLTAFGVRTDDQPRP